MPKRLFFVSLLVIAVLLITSMTVFASNQQNDFLKRTPKVPGAAATLNAFHKPTQLPENKKTPEPEKKSQNFRGEIYSLAADSLLLSLTDGSTLTFAITNETQIKIPTLGRKATYLNLVVGQEVTVRARKDGTNQWEALSIHVIPGKPAILQHKGTVTAYTAGTSITILDNRGNSYTFVINAETKILSIERANALKVGAVVTVISPREVAGNLWIAKAIVLHPDLSGTKTPEPNETPEPTELPAL